MKIKLTFLVALLLVTSAVLSAQTTTITKLHTRSNPTVWMNLEMVRGEDIKLQATYSGFTDITKIEVQFLNNWGGAPTMSVDIPSPYTGTIDTDITVPNDFPVHSTFGGDGAANQLIKFRIVHSGGSYFHSFGAQEYATIKVKSPVISATGVDVVPEIIDLSIAEDFTAVASLVPSNTTNTTIVWSSDATSVATVDASTGVVTGVAVGTANIIATTDDGSFKDTCVVTVVASAIAVTGISLDIAATELDKLDTLALVPTFAPLSASNKDITWSSSAEAVATVSADGEVIALTLGTTTITATTDEGSFTATSVITVVPAAFMVFDDKANYVGPEFETGGSMTVNVSYAMGANRTINDKGLLFRLRHLNSGWAFGTSGYDISAKDLTVVGSNEGTATATISLADAPLTDTIVSGDFLWLWVSCKDDEDKLHEVKTTASDVIKIIAATATGLELVKQRLSVYPNPAENNLCIQGMQGEVAVAIYSLDGKQLMNKNIGLERFVDVSSLVRGQYVLQAKDDMGVNAQLISIK